MKTLFKVDFPSKVYPAINHSLGVHTFESIPNKVVFGINNGPVDMPYNEVQKLYEVLGNWLKENKQSNVSATKLCDPPEGWKYGFPKAIPTNISPMGDSFKKWLVENGYPQHLIKEYGDHFMCRFWFVD